ncbi:hypothetical protein A2U01_0005096 [Trifolium medium]|uniref:Uncharacterized protein n=1 Tax=Trifolium medium TaxID=97028 RepID=A0A392MAY1_9FABA|nr:hypothetical protein [Trifolium medium]
MDKSSKKQKDTPVRRSSRLNPPKPFKASTSDAKNSTKSKCQVQRVDSSDSDEFDPDWAEFLKTYKPEDESLNSSSASDKTDSDYAEFLRTYNPEESWDSDQENSQVTVESKPTRVTEKKTKPASP